MIAPETLWQFSPWEVIEYNRQKSYGRFRLLMADDALDHYSCHSQAHVLEVMTQCDLLLRALAPWLRAQAPGMGEADLAAHLLVAAKLHDIRMGGSDEEFRLLGLLDDLFGWMGTRPEGHAPDQFRARMDEVAAAVQGLAFTGGPWDELLALGLSGMPDAARWARLRSSLAACHEALKNGIRRHHAPAGGALVARERDRLAARYGEALDWPMIALLVALHSTSSTGLRAVTCLPGPDGDATRDYVAAYAREHLGEQACRHLLEERCFRRLTALAALLRLADTRRSGSRMRLLDDRPVRCELNAAGQATLYIGEGTGRRRVTKRKPYTILLPECCTEFGDVALTGCEGGWLMEHSLTLNGWQSPDVRGTFLASRLETYLAELESAMLAAGPGMVHRLTVLLPGCGDGAIPTELRRGCGEVGPLARQYADAVTFVPVHG